MARGSGPKGGGGGGWWGGPWSPKISALEPGALKFLLWSPEPDHLALIRFLAVELGAQRSCAWSPKPRIFKFDHSSS